MMEDDNTVASQAEHAICVVTAEDHSFELNEKQLESILLREDVRDKNVVVVSVAGAFRKGKSFLLNFMIRYLEAKGESIWIGNEDESLQGFSWRGGSERETTGILFWSKVYIIEVPSGEEVAVLLMDTQGAFDSSSTVKECATVFALSTMLSSIQVYNLSQNIQEDDLQHLELFAEYGRLAIEDSKETPFQKLVFLVRDWSYPYDAPYGLDGGRSILDRRLQISERQHPQLQQLRRHIKSCFSEVTCFLMPHPGLEVATDASFNGKLSNIRDEFKENLKVLMPQLLAPENLLPKKIGGRCVTARELISYFKTYVAIFQGDELPEPKSMLEATAEANNLAAVANAKEFYTSAMENVCGGNRPFLNNETLEKNHVEIKDAAVQKFVQTRRMGSVDFSNQYMEKLQKELEEMYNSYIKFNDSKKIVNALRTPVCLVFLVLITYMNSYLMSALGLQVISYFSNMAMLASIITLCTWGYSRFTGDYQNISEYIDTMVTFVLVNYIVPSQKALMQMLPDTPNDEGSTSPPLSPMKPTVHLHNNLIQRQTAT